jgi:hypothetical protein
MFSTDKHSSLLQQKKDSKKIFPKIWIYDFSSDQKWSYFFAEKVSLWGNFTDKGPAL